MRIRWCFLLLAAVPVVAGAQNTLPPDIHPQTLSRLPPVTAEDLDEEGKRLLAARTNFTAGPGPADLPGAAAASARRLATLPTVRPAIPPGAAPAMTVERS